MKKIASKHLALKAQTLQIILLLIAFFLAVYLRYIMGQPEVSQSAVAGITFGILLVIFSYVGGMPKTRFSWRIIGYGLAGILIVCIVPFLANGIAAPHPAGSFVVWALIVSFVAGAQELFLRGTLFNLLQGRIGQLATVVVTAILFVLLHLPLYGLESIGLNMAVGLFLGGLRVYSGSWLAPGIAHIGADLVGWWLI